MTKAAAVQTINRRNMENPLNGSAKRSSAANWADVLLHLKSAEPRLPVKNIRQNYYDYQKRFYREHETFCRGQTGLSLRSDQSPIARDAVAIR